MIAPLNTLSDLKELAFVAQNAREGLGSAQQAIAAVAEGTAPLRLQMRAELLIITPEQIVNGVLPPRVGELLTPADAARALATVAEGKPIFILSGLNLRAMREHLTPILPTS